MSCKSASWDATLFNHTSLPKRVAEVWAPAPKRFNPSIQPFTAVHTGSVHLSMSVSAPPTPTPARSPSTRRRRTPTAAAFAARPSRHTKTESKRPRRTSTQGFQQFHRQFQQNTTVFHPASPPSPTYLHQYQYQPQPQNSPGRKYINSTPLYTPSTHLELPTYLPAALPSAHMYQDQVGAY